MSRTRISIAIALAAPLSLATFNIGADDAGAFIGGIFAAKILDNMQRRTRAEEAQARQYSPPATYSTYSSAPASAPRQSPEDKLDNLDRLAAGGYITPEEYQARRKAILESM